MVKFVLIMTSRRNRSLLSIRRQIPTGNGTTEHQEPLSSQQEPSDVMVQS